MLIINNYSSATDPYAGLSDVFQQDNAASFIDLNATGTFYNNGGSTISVTTDTTISNYAIRGVFQGNGIPASGYIYVYVPAVIGQQFKVVFWMRSTAASINAGATAWSGCDDCPLLGQHDYLTPAEVAAGTWVFREYNFAATITGDMLFRWYNCPNSSGVNGIDNISVDGLRVFNLG